MKNFKKHIISIIFILSVLNTYSQYFQELDNLKIDFKELKQLGKVSFFKKYDISQNSLNTVTSIKFENYVGDSIIITPKDFPNLNSIEFYQLKSDAVALNGLSKFTNLKMLKISFYKLGFNTNLDEIYKCVNLESLSINHLFPVEISDSIKNLRNLKEFGIFRLANPEVLCQLNNWQNIYKNYCIDEKAVDFIICCKLSGFTYDEVLAISTCVESFDYNFNIDSTFTIYRMDGTKACTGMLKNGKRFGVWEYFFNYSDYNEIKKYTYTETGRLIKRKNILYNNKKELEHKQEIIFSSKNSKTHFKFLRIEIYYKYINDIMTSDTSIFETMQMLDTLTNKFYYLSGSGTTKYLIDFNKKMKYNIYLENGEITIVEGHKFSNGYFYYSKKEIIDYQSENCIDCFSTEILEQLLSEIDKFKELEEYFVK